MKRLWQLLKKICSELLILPIRIYQKCISPFIPPRCRFSPTCSCYAVTALRRFGPIRGSLLTICRLARCQPFGRPGYDPVPQRFSLRPFAGALQEKQTAHPSQHPAGDISADGETIPHENGNGGSSL